MAAPLESEAKANEELRRLVRQKAALTRVATIVAEGVPAAELFAALTHEVVHALGVPSVSLVRYEADGSTVVLASLNAPDFTVGARLPLDGDSLSATVLETGRPARAESELRSEVGVPIVVDGEVWGLIRAGARRPEPLPADIEASLRDFTELVATAISKTESRESLRRVDAEQTALRNVATLVAEGAAPAEVFSCVAHEVARILDVSAVSVVRFESDTWSVVVASFNDPGFPVGSRWPLEDPSLNATVFRTGQPAQIDYSELPGPVAAAARSTGLRVGVGVPIVVEGRIWGMIAVGQRHRRDALPAFAGSYSGRIVLSTASPHETQARLAAFTELVATAISKAQAHDDLSGLATEQAALRRVATLVAEGVAPDRIFEAVCEQVGHLLEADFTALEIFPGDGTATLIAAWSKDGQPMTVGKQLPLEPDTIAARIVSTHAPARRDSDDSADVEAGPFGRNLQLTSTVGAPILVGGRLWGALMAGTRRSDPWAEEAEARLAGFTELIATAIANAEARDALEKLADEQAALRRVATLVAEETAPPAVFGSVAEEVGRLLRADRSFVARFDADDVVTIVGEWAADGRETEVEPLGCLDGAGLSRVIRDTRGSARIDWTDDSWAGLPAVRRLGLRSAVAVPITIEGRLWGLLEVAWTSEEPVPRGTEERLPSFARLVATAIVNAEVQAELTASRARIVATADETRRRIERDLHDGIQQRLIALTFRARAMARKPPAELPGLVAELADGLLDISDELREIARGIHPTILTEAGLGPALRALARRSDTPIDVDVTLDDRLPAPVEAAAYYIASEGLTNVAKHARATLVTLTAANDNGVLTLEVRDDGIGGVDARRGSGILGLADRVKALGGRFTLESPPGHGTSISVELPIVTSVTP